MAGRFCMNDAKGSEMDGTADPLLTTIQVSQSSSNAAADAGALAVYVDLLGDLIARFLALEHKIDADAGISGTDYTAAIGTVMRPVFRETRGAV